MAFGNFRKAILASSLLIVASSGWAQRGPAAGQGRGQPAGAGTCQALVGSLPLQPLDAAEAEGIIYMREEEKLAHDVYAQLYAKWGSQVFSNIVRSEQRHMDAVKMLADRYGLADPAAGNGVGIFSNAGLQTLYGDLVAMGSVSPASALRVGATIEDLDIRDLDKAIAGTDNEDLKTVYTNLRNGSRNHLRAFVTQLGALGESYTAQYITAETLAQILANANASGNCAGNCSGGMVGNRWGNGTCPMGNTPAGTPGTGPGRPW